MHSRWLRRLTLFASSGLLACSQVMIQAALVKSQNTQTPPVLEARWIGPVRNTGSSWYPSAQAACGSEHDVVPGEPIPPYGSTIHATCDWRNGDGGFITQAFCELSYLYIGDTNGGVCVLNTVLSTEEELEGIWDVALPGINYKMTVVWNQQSGMYEGYLSMHGNGSKEAGYNIGELVWQGAPSNTLGVVNESQKWRWTENNINYEEWRNNPISFDEPSGKLAGEEAFVDQPLGGGGLVVGLVRKYAGRIAFKLFKWGDKSQTNQKPNNPLGTPTQNWQVPISLNRGSQNKHIPGTNEWKTATSTTANQNRSILSYKDPEGLIRKFAGTGSPANTNKPGTPGYRERVDFGEKIGTWKSGDGLQQSETAIGIIHYGSKGAHIIPARP